MHGVIGSKTRKIPKVYGVVGSVTRKISKVYGVVSGVTRLIFSGATIVKGVYKGIFVDYHTSSDYYYGIKYERTGSSIAGYATWFSDPNYYSGPYFEAISEDGMYLMYNSRYTHRIYKWNGTTYSSYCTLDLSNLGYSFQSYNDPTNFCVCIGGFDQHGDYFVFFSVAYLTSGSSNNRYIYSFVFKNNGSTFEFVKATPITGDYSGAGTSYCYSFSGGSYHMSKDLKCAAGDLWYNNPAYSYSESYHENLILYDTGNFNYSVVDRMNNGSYGLYSGNRYLTSDSVNKYFVLFQQPSEESNYNRYLMDYINNGTSTRLFFDSAFTNVYRRGLISNENGCIYFVHGGTESINIRCYYFNGSSITLLGSLMQNTVHGPLRDMTIDGTVLVAAGIYEGGGYYYKVEVCSVSMDSTGLITAITELKSFDYENEYNDIFMIDRT